MAGGNIPIQDVLNANPVYTFRGNLGDLKPLIAHIRRHGQEAPVLLDANYMMIDGARRLEALRKLRSPTVWAVSSSKWEVVQRELLNVAKRHEYTDFLHKEFVDLAYLLAYLVDLKREHRILEQRGVSKAERTRRAKNRVNDPRNPTLPRGLVVGMERDINFATVNVLSRAGSYIREQAFLGNQANVKAIEEILGRFSWDNRDRLFASLQEIAEVVNPELTAQREARAPKAPTTQQSIAAQAKAIDRALNMMQGLVAALPLAATISTTHPVEDIAKWQKEIAKITVPIRRLNVRLTQIQKEKDSGPTEDSDES